MKKLDEQIKRIKELMTEETLYGKNIDLITESTVTSKLKKLFGGLDISFGKLSTELDDAKFIKNFKANEWANNVTENLRNLKDLPNISTNPKIREVNKILTDNKKIMDDITEYFNTLEIDPSKSKPENTKLFNNISRNLPEFNTNIEKTKKLLMLPSNKLTDDNIKFISEMTGYDIPSVNKLLSSLSDTIKHIDSGINTSKKVISTISSLYTKDGYKRWQEALVSLLPGNIFQAIKKGVIPRWIKVLTVFWVQGYFYGTLYKIIRCELYGDEETNELISSWGPEEKSLWKKHEVNSLSKIVESINENNIIVGGLNTLSGGFIKAIAGDCTQVDEDILQKLIDDGKINIIDAQNIRDLGMKYLKAKGFDKYITDVKEKIGVAKQSIKSGDKESFNSTFSNTSGWE
jgi:hypothetical protein